jgi:hypothetical protein
LSESSEIANAAIIGYNTTRILLERAPTSGLLHRIAFFSGHVWRSDSISGDLKQDYFLAIQSSAKKLLDASKINEDDFLSIMLNLSWYGLVARAPQSALSAAEAGLKVNSKYIQLETNRAHALVLLGKRDEGFGLYKKYKGVKIRDELWNNIIIDDFNKLEKLGVRVIPKGEYGSLFFGGD